METDDELIECMYCESIMPIEQCCMGLMSVVECAQMKFTQEMEKYKK